MTARRDQRWTLRRGWVVRGRWWHRGCRRARLARLRWQEHRLAFLSQATGDPVWRARLVLVRMARRTAEGALSHPTTKDWRS